jgi:two-component system invasion response regulator UvrY
MEKEIILDKEEHRRNRVYITPRELEIIDCLSNGLNSGEIAKKLGITLKTAEVHRHNVLKKTAY